MPAAYAIFHRGKAITPSDGTNQPHQWARILCVTAGSLVFTVLDADTGFEGASTTIALTAGQIVEVTPVKILAAGTTGTYFGLIGS